MNSLDPLTIDDDDEPANNDLASQAMRWVVRLTSGETTAEERLAFQHWRDESPEHAAALADARGLWLALGPALRSGEVRRTRRFGPMRLGAIAASLLAVALLGGQYFESWRHDYVTGRGERRSVVLSDGTQVLMNGRSALDIDFANGERHVTLARGEAYFDVVHDPARPFTVVAGSGRVSDVGTAFAVRRTSDGADVIVARGEVEVAPSLPGTAHAFLTQNQALSYDASRTTAVRTKDAAQELGWVHDRLILESRTLSDSVDEINRYYKGRLVLLNAQAGGLRINAVIDLNHIDDWLQALDKTHTVHVARVSSLVFIY